MSENFEIKSLLRTDIPSLGEINFYGLTLSADSGPLAVETFNIKLTLKITSVLPRMCYTNDYEQNLPSMYYVTDLKHPRLQTCD